MSKKKKINKDNVQQETGKKTRSTSENQSTSTSGDSTAVHLKTGKTKVFWKKKQIIFSLCGLVIIALIVFGIVSLQQFENTESLPVKTSDQNSPSGTPSVSSSTIEISNISVTDITDKSMTIQWKTNLPATTEVNAMEQKTSNSVGGWPDNKLVIEHKVILEKLIPSSSYTLKIKSKDASGNEALFESKTTYQTRASKSSTEIAIGEKSPDFSLQSLTGENVSLSAQRDKKIMLVFWMLSCSSCREELPFLQDFWENTKTEDLLLFAINIGENENLIKNFAISQKLTFPILLDQNSEVSKKYTIVRYPTIFLLGPDKTVIKVREEPFKNVEEIRNFVQ